VDLALVDAQLNPSQDVLVPCADMKVSDFQIGHVQLS
jgi:hypothetical protein